LSMCTQCIDLVNAPNLKEHGPERSRTPALAFVTTIPFSKSGSPSERETQRGGSPSLALTHLSLRGRCPCQ
jgi:hypothetical protein